MTDSITVYRAGHLATEEAPAWRDAEIERIYPESAERAPSVHRIVYGNVERVSITCWSRGRVC